VVAGRIAAAAPELSVLVIEGGETNVDHPLSVSPALFPLNLAPKSKTAVWYRAQPSEELAGREIMLPTGGMLGGGESTIVKSSNGTS
jgi:alcohol oxidase